MKRYKRLIIWCLLACTLLTMIPMAAMAYETPEPPAVTETADESGIMPAINETGWYYKAVDGLLYKRLWSYTYGRWETDWIRA